MFVIYHIMQFQQSLIIHTLLYQTLFLLLCQYLLHCQLILLLFGQNIHMLLLFAANQCLASIYDNLNSFFGDIEMLGWQR